MKNFCACLCGVAMLSGVTPSRAEWMSSGKLRYEVIACENMVALAQQESVQLLQQVRDALNDGPLSAKLRKQVKAQVVALEEIRETLFSVARRGEPNYYDAVCDTMDANFEGIIDSDGKPFNPKKAYEVLGFESKKAMLFTYDVIKFRIDAELKTKTITKDRKKLLRQLQYLFANQYTKQEYDAYLQGRRAVEALRISSGESDRLIELIGGVLEIKATLEELSK